MSEIPLPRERDLCKAPSPTVKQNKQLKMSDIMCNKKYKRSVNKVNTRDEGKCKRLSFQ